LRPENAGREAQRFGGYAANSGRSSTISIRSPRGNMSTYEYDLVVLGAGSGGLATAKRAVSYGARVAIVEDDRVGGTCVIRGCIPKKLMVYAADHGHAIGDAAGYGWSVGSKEFDWKKLVARRDEAVLSLERTHERLLDKAGVELLRGRGRLTGANEVSIGDRAIRTRHILIATGSTPVLPGVEGIEHAITSDGFFELEEQPRRVAIVGAGYIAVEFASILNGLGTEVSLLLRRELPLRSFDHDLSSELLAGMRGAGIDVRTKTQVMGIEREAGVTRLALDTENGVDLLEVDNAIVYAVGRRPNTKDLGLEEAGVICASSGEVVVDEDQITSIDGVFAVGDVTDQAPLTPVAIQAGRALADRVFGGKSVQMNYEDIPTAVFSDPPIGTVGPTEAEAVERYGAGRIKVYKESFTPLLHMLTERKTRTMVKMIVDKQTDRVLACHMIGHDAPEIIQGLGVAIKAGARKADFDATVGIHPSSAEEFVTLT
jgi:glutathione reductase (NADPH)